MSAFSTSETRHIPPPTLAQAALRNLVIVLIPIVLLVGGAVAYGIERKPVYTSTAQLGVGGVNLPLQAISGYSVAVAQLAVTYARSVDAPQIVEPAARQAGVTPADAVRDLSATPVEGSAVIRVSAETKDAGQAQRLADGAADALAAYAARLNRNNPDTPRLLRQFVADSRAVRDATTAVGKAKSAAERKSAQTSLAVAKLRQQTDGALYQQSQSGGGSTTLVRKIAPAAAATSDRSSMLQRYVIAALIAGALIGGGLAMARESSRRRRLAR